MANTFGVEVSADRKWVDIRVIGHRLALKDAANLAAILWDKIQQTEEGKQLLEQEAKEASVA